MYRQTKINSLPFSRPDGDVPERFQRKTIILISPEINANWFGSSVKFYFMFALGPAADQDFFSTRLTLSRLVF